MPAGGRPGRPKSPKPAVFESIAALGLLPSRALSSGWTNCFCASSCSIASRISQQLHILLRRAFFLPLFAGRFQFGVTVFPDLFRPPASCLLAGCCNRWRCIAGHAPRRPRNEIRLKSEKLRQRNLTLQPPGRNVGANESDAKPVLPERASFKKQIPMSWSNRVTFPLVDCVFQCRNLSTHP